MFNAGILSDIHERGIVCGLVDPVQDIELSKTLRKETAGHIPYIKVSERKGSVTVYDHRQTSCKVVKVESVFATGKPYDYSAVIIAPEECLCLQYAFACGAR